MATSKSQLFSDSDKAFLAEQLGYELFYARRDANTVFIGKARKSDAKLRFDRDHFKRVQILAAAFEVATGIKPAERQLPDLDNFMSRIGKTFEPMQEVPAHQQASTEEVPWNMNAPF